MKNLSRFILLPFLSKKDAGYQFECLELSLRNMYARNVVVTNSEGSSENKNIIFKLYLVPLLCCKWCISVLLR